MSKEIKYFESAETPEGGSMLVRKVGEKGHIRRYIYTSASFEHIETGTPGFGTVLQSAYRNALAVVNFENCPGDIPPSIAFLYHADFDLKKRRGMDRVFEGSATYYDPYHHTICLSIRGANRFLRRNPRPELLERELTERLIEASITRYLPNYGQMFVGFVSHVDAGQGVKSIPFGAYHLRIEGPVPTGGADIADVDQYYYPKEVYSSLIESLLDTRKWSSFLAALAQDEGLGWQISSTEQTMKLAGEGKSALRTLEKSGVQNVPEILFEALGKSDYGLIENKIFAALSRKMYQYPEDPQKIAEFQDLYMLLKSQFTLTP